jgi:D-arabinitol 4-dehydrogenase
MSNPELFQTHYDLQSCDTGIVHIGYGAFHRAHQAVYIDDYMEATDDKRWGIAAVNLREADSAAFQKAAKINEGYIVKTISPDGTFGFRLVRSHMEFVDIATQAETAYNLLARPSVCAVTITVTESGYYINGSLDLEAEPIAADIAGKTSETIYAYLANALDCRAQTIDAPITILCCDNIRSNGRMLEEAFLTYLEVKDRVELVNWVRNNVSFPCSMVDRITPQSTSALQDEISRDFPANDTAPIHAETYMQWVIEDKFVSPMPDLSKAGVQIVPDVEPYEEAKIRILNGGHTGLAYLGALAGHQTFDQAIRDPDLRDHFYRWEQNEVLKGLGENIPFDTSIYLDEITRRFENQGISDPLERICMEGYSKMGIFIKPTLEACLSKGIVPEAGFDCVASWVVYARKSQNGHCNIPYHETFWDKLEPMIAQDKEEEIASDSKIWGDLPERFENFVPGVVNAIKRMNEKTWQI